MKKQSEILQKELKDFIDMYGMDNMFLKGRIEEAKRNEAKIKKIKERIAYRFQGGHSNVLDICVEEIDKIIEEKE